MTIAVTGATGHLGRLAIDALLGRGVPAADLVAVVRDPRKADDLAARGVQVRIADYTDRPALEAALVGVEKLLLVSSSEMGARVSQHTNVIEAAKTAGVGFIAYTSVLHAPTSSLLLAREHRATEQVLAESGIGHALLRNGWYWENFTNDIAGTAERGVLIGSAGEGRVAGAARADFAEAAAVVLTSGEEQAGRVYELAGDERLTYPELAEVFTQVTGKPVRYQDLPVEQYRAALESAGIPAQYVDLLADSDVGISVGALDDTSGEMQRLIGRPATAFATVLRNAL